jgi:hypothetical protein
MVDATALTIAKYNLKNKVNRINATPAVWVAILGLQVLLVGFVASPNSPGGVLALGEALAQGDVQQVVTKIQATVLSMYLLLTLMSAFNWITGSEDANSCERGFLGMTDPSNVAFGSIVESMVAMFAGFFPATLVACLALGVSAGHPLGGLGMFVAAAFLLVTTQLIGAPVGIAGQWLISRSDNPDRVESIFATVTILVVSMTFVYSSELGQLLATTPLRYIASVPLAALVPGAVSPVTAVLATLAIVAVASLMSMVTIRLAEPFYLSDSMSADEDDETDGEEDDTDGRVSTALVEPLLSERQATLVGVNWTRMVRSPEMLQRAGMYVLLGLVVGFSSVRGQGGVERLPGVLMLFGAIYAGQFVTLNALTDEGPRMSLWGTSSADGHDLFVSKAASTAVPMLLVFGVPSVLAATMLAGYGPLPLVTLVVMVVVGIVGSAVVSTGIGFLWITADDDDPESDMSFPSLLMSGIHFAAVFVLVSPGFAGVLMLAGAVDASASTATTLGTIGSSVVVTLGVAAFFYVTSMQKVDGRHYGSVI